MAERWRHPWMVDLDKLAPDVLPEDSQESPHAQSFASLREKTQRTLYDFDGKDKSPKGSVDEPIRPLVDLINHHGQFTTLSTCSGRIAIFENSASANEVGDADQEDTGKGYGKWIYVNHDLADAKEVQNVIDQSSYNRNFVVLKFEPLLLHVAAPSLARARQFLGVALRLGLRESGLVVTNKRITVGIRTQSLALTVPILPGITEEYITQLVDLANRRHRQNWEQLKAFYKEVQSTLFEYEKPRRQLSCQLSSHSIPDLRLWGHAAVSIAGCDVFVFGGYGRGPDENQTKSQRSSSVYCLKKIDGVWEDSWERIDTSVDVDQERTWNGIRVSTCQFQACQGAVACHWNSDLILLWGGREGPSSPLKSIYIYNISEQAFGIPTSVAGTAPPPRWGHSLTKISDDRILIMGGCNAQGPISPNVPLVLSFQESNDGITQLRWETMANVVLPPRFHHTCAYDDESETISIFGGLTEASPLAPAASEAIRLQLSDPHQLNIIRIDNSSHFGATYCQIQGTIVHVGGVGASGSTAISCCEWNGETRSFEDIPTAYAGVDFGSMIHHQCVSVGEQDYLLVGGGTHLFAFGDTFASCQLVSLDMVEKFTDDNTVGDVPVSNKTQSAAPRATSRSATTNVSPSQQDATCRVLYVNGRDAKRAKTKLETLGYLSAVHRMTKAENGTIMLPVTDECWNLRSSADVDWTSFVVGDGERIMPLKTSQFARKGKSR